MKQNGFILKCTNDNSETEASKEDIIYILSYTFEGGDPS
jgi:hypothetical protein